jgi:integrase
MKRPPRLCHHKAQQLGYIYVAGKPVYFAGHWPRGQKIPPAGIAEQYVAAVDNLAKLKRKVAEAHEPRPGLLIDELWAAYKRFSEGYYRKNGRPTSEAQCILDACRIVAREYGETPAADFGPRKLKRVRELFQAAGWSREHINKQAGRVKRMFRWAVSEELVDETVWRALRSLPDLRAGDGLREPRKVEAVSDADLERAILRCPVGLQDLVRVHRLIGCRADEACIMRTCDFDQAAAPGLWTFTPSSSKNAASYWVGPRAQAILTPLLRPESPEAWIFPTRSRGRGCWHTSSYRRAVLRACRLAGVPRWSPLQVRHTAGQEARERHSRGIEATQARLQHKEVTVSQVYASNLDKLAQDVARQLG